MVAWFPKWANLFLHSGLLSCMSDKCTSAASHLLSSVRQIVRQPVSALQTAVGLLASGSGLVLWMVFRLKSGRLDAQHQAIWRRGTPRRQPETALPGGPCPHQRLTSQLRQPQRTDTPHLLKAVKVKPRGPASIHMAYLSQEPRARAETNLSETKWRARGDEFGRRQRSDEGDHPSPLAPVPEPSGIATTVAQPAQKTIQPESWPKITNTQHGSISHQSAPEMEVRNLKTKKWKRKLGAGTSIFLLLELGCECGLMRSGCAAISLVTDDDADLRAGPRASNPRCVISESFISPRPIWISFPTHASNGLICIKCLFPSFTFRFVLCL